MRAGIWQERADMIRPYSGKGLSVPEVSEKLGWSVCTVIRYVKRFNLDIARSRADNIGVEAVRQMADNGLTRTEVADAFGISYAKLCQIAANNSIAFNHPCDERSAMRADAMASMYKGGKTLKEIGDLYGITRERVRQLISKYHGLTAEDGGQRKLAALARYERRRRREAECLAKNGCTCAQLEELRRLGREAMANGIGRDRTPVGAFNRQRTSARARGISWDLSLWDWWTIWQDSGKWEQRGRAGDAYVMCRFGDEGPYEVGNVYIATLRHNSTVQPNNPYRSNHPDHDKVWDERRSAA